MYFFFIFSFSFIFLKKRVVGRDNAAAATVRRRSEHTHELRTGSLSSHLSRNSSFDFSVYEVLHLPIIAESDQTLALEGRTDCSEVIRCFDFPLFLLIYLWPWVLYVFKQHPRGAAGGGSGDRGASGGERLCVSKVLTLDFPAIPCCSSIHLLI